MHMKICMFALLIVFLSTFDYVKCQDEDDPENLANVEYNKFAMHRKSMKCSKPKENKDIFHSCQGQFPASKTKCSCTNNCGRSVTLHCYNDKWQRARGLRTCSKTFTSKKVLCVHANGKKAPTCRCKSNCMKLNKACKTMSQKDIDSICSSTEIKKIRKNNIISYFEEGSRKYVCVNDKDFQLVGNASRKCNSGILEGNSPKCQPIPKQSMEDNEA